MFADYVKMGAKIALIAVITAAIIALFTVVQIPNLDFTLLSTGISTALAIMYHWVPAAQVVVPLAFTMLGVQLAILLFEYAMIAVRWILKVNE